MAPIQLRKTSPAAMREALAAHGFEMRMTSLDSGRVLRRGSPVGLWSNGQLELQLSAEELSRVRKSLTGLGIAA
ncbi:MAG TPA: hypothetical protein VJB16_01665 [archaeon]|nr:hypothetical protein [archaeon]